MKTLWKQVVRFLSLSLLLSGCLYPDAPGRGIVSKTQAIPELNSEWALMATYRKTTGMIGTKFGPSTTTVKRKKNLLFIAADDVVGKKLAPEIEKIYKKPVRLENLLWWSYAPKIQKTYNTVLRVQWDGFNFNNLKRALLTMESMGQTYDVMLLAHGIPNNLIASPGQGMIGFQEIAALKTLQHADTLYLQACFGNTLSKDFLDLGFEAVIAYEGFNQNFFYPEYYLNALERSGGDTRKAHASVVKNFDWKFKFNPVQKAIVKRVFGSDEDIQGSPKKYLEVLEMPALYER